MIKGLDHVAIAVENLDDAVAQYRDLLGLAVESTEEVPEQGVRVAKLRAGAVTIELLEPLTPETPVGRFLASRGPGLHHLAYHCDDLDADLERLRQAGARLIDAEPRIGAGGLRIAFVHPAATGGVLTELCSLPPGGHRTDTEGEAT